MTKEEFHVEVKVNGRALEMLPFVQQIVAGTLWGLVGQLKGTEEARQIEIGLRRKETEAPLVQ